MPSALANDYWEARRKTVPLLMFDRRTGRINYLLAGCHFQNMSDCQQCR